MNPLQELNARASGVLVDPWMYADPAAHPVAPCRSVEITAEFRAADALRHAKASRCVSVEAAAWRERLQLNPENLRVVRTAPATALRQADTRKIVVAVSAQERHRIGKRPRKCAEATCERMLSASAKGELCRWCRNKAIKRVRPGRPLCACGGPLSNRWRGLGQCGKCRKAARTAAVDAPEMSATPPRTTVLVAGSEEEYELDQTWAALGLEDKGVVLADAVA